MSQFRQLAAITFTDIVGYIALVIALTLSLSFLHAQDRAISFNDSHFHLTNYIQKGTDINDFLKIMGNSVGRSTLFGIPLQQTWSYSNTGEFAPSYYLHSDAPLYYYSFTDAYIATVYNSLSDIEKTRFDPMITGFNPADMYAVHHIKRVLNTFPGVFSGIGEFSIHKEFVSSKIAGESASLTNPALDSIFRFCEESGLVAILHCDVDIPFQTKGKEPFYLAKVKEVVARYPAATVIWAHIGLGRVIFPPDLKNSLHNVERSGEQLSLLEKTLINPKLRHLYFDISWEETAKFIVANPVTIKQMAQLINKYPDRFLFGTDVVAPRDSTDYFAVYHLYQPLWDALTHEASEMVRLGNYVRLFDEANSKVRVWEEKNH